MVKNVIIVTPSLIDFSSGKLKIGGLETYVRDLALLCRDNGYEVCIFQHQKDAPKESVLLLEGIQIVPLVGKLQKGFESLYANYNRDEAVFIVATDQMDVKSDAKNVITIQHGIAFDIPGNLITGIWGKCSLLQHVNKMLRCVKNVKRLYNTRNTVCVDYNYYNWFRTLGTIDCSRQVTVIPNYTSGILPFEELNDKLSTPKELKKIVFARRFVDYRGTLMFANVVQRLLSERSDIDITFAGSGPLKTEVEKMFSGDERVHFSSFNASETIGFHKNFDIAVVPTIFSEGTSLSLCEAMAAGCLGVATHVGGLTNILIDNYNGFLCAPTEDSLYNTLSEVLNLPPSDYERIVRCGYNTVIGGFSHKLWAQKWLKIITQISYVG